MEIKQMRAVLVRKHKTVIFIDGLCEGELLSVMVPKEVLIGGFDCYVGDVLEVCCEYQLNRSNKWVWTAKSIRLVSKCLPNITYELNNCNDVLKQSRFKSMLGRKNIKMWEFRSEFLNRLPIIMENLGMRRVYSSGMMKYRGTSTASPIPCVGKFTGNAFLNITHEIELKKTCILTMCSLFNLAFVYRDIYPTVKRVPEIMMLEGVILGNQVANLVNLVKKIIETAVQVAKEFDIPYDERFESIAEVDCLELFGASLENNYQFYSEYALQISNPTILLNAPIVSPFVKKDKNGLKTEIKFFVNHTSFFHGYIDENNFDRLKQAFTEQYLTLIAKDERAELPKDYLELLKFGAPETYSFGFGIDRFLANFLMMDSVQHMAHLLGI